MEKLITVNKGKAVTTSRKVAEVFEKKHCDVLRAIKNLEIPEDFRERNFALSEYEVTNNLGKTVKYPEWLITRDGFSLLAMGFTGKKAMEFKIAFINAFNAMEEILKSAPTPEVNARMDLKSSTVELLTKINQQLLSGERVDKDVLRYAVGLGTLFRVAIQRSGVPDSITEFVMGIPCGEFTRGEIYDMYRERCKGTPVSPRRFWPAVRLVRPCYECRHAYVRKVVFE